MKVLHHVLNAILPYECPCCESNFLEPFMTLCTDCTGYFNKNLQSGNLSINDLCNARFIDQREFYFNNLYFLGNYTAREKVVFQKAKFQDDALMQSCLLSYLIKIFSEQFKNRVNRVIPAPSSREIIRFFSSQLARSCEIPLSIVFKKTRKQQNKKMDQFSRFSEIQNNIIFNPHKKIQLKPDEKILIFDDLWTTGATMNHLCRLLVEQGIPREQIDVLVLFIRPKISP